MAMTSRSSHAEKPVMDKWHLTLGSVLGLGVLSWILLLLIVAGVLWLADLVGGGSVLFSCVGCALASRFFWTAAGKEPVFTKVIGYGLSGVLAACSVTILAGGIS